METDLKELFVQHYALAMQASDSEDYQKAYENMLLASKEAKQLAQSLKNSADAHEFAALSHEFADKANTYRGLASSDSVNVTMDVSDVPGLSSFIGLNHIRSYLTETVVVPWRNGTFYQRKKSAILIYGPRGVGKTRFAHSLISELSASGYSIQPFHFFDLSNCPAIENFLIKIFDEAEKKNNVVFLFEQPAPFFPDGDNITSLDTAELFIRIFKNEIRRIRRKKLNILFVATTSVPDKMTKKAWSNDLFDDFIRIDYPDEEIRRFLLTKALEEKEGLTENDLSYLVTASEGFVSTDVSRLGREVAMLGDSFSTVAMKEWVNNFKPLKAQGFKDNVNSFEEKIKKFEIIH